MIKIFKYIFLVIFSYIYLFGNVFYAEYKVDCGYLPGCELNPNKLNNTQVTTKAIPNIIAEAIQYVAVFAVIALMISGIMYLVSGGEEEKTKSAKNWIIWSMVGTFLSISAWLIINLINQLQI